MSNIKTLRNNRKINKMPCLACPFLLQDSKISERSEAEYRVLISQLNNGVTRNCDCDPSQLTDCRGQKNTFLNIWYSQGKIESPVDESLEKYQKKMNELLDKKESIEDLVKEIFDYESVDIIDNSVIGFYGIKIKKHKGNLKRNETFDSASINIETGETTFIKTINGGYSTKELKIDI